MMEATLFWHKQIKELLSTLAQSESSLVDLQITHLLIDKQTKSEDTHTDKSYFVQEIEFLVCQNQK